MKKRGDREVKGMGALRRELSEVSRRAFLRGLVTATGGNMSVRVPGTEKILVTPSGISLEEVDPKDNILVDFEGKILSSSRELKPSKETSFHLSVYRLRPDVGAIAHFHPPYATAYSNKGKPLPLATISSRVILKEVPWVECAIPGSKELCDFVSDGIMRYPGVKVLLMKEHGVLALGPDLKAAYYLADLVEATAKIAFIEENIKTP
jgi:L-fuculose-phosphate aldolase